jgi:hypothetical protein
MPKLTVLLLAALAACSTVPRGTASPPPATASAPAGLGAGVYTVTLADSDLPYSAVAAGMSPRMVGTWEMTVDRPGHAMVRFNGQEVVEMPFEAQGNQVTFAGGTGQYACASSGRYTWETTADSVRFTRAEDSCHGRVIALTSRAWTKRP